MEGKRIIGITGGVGAGKSSVLLVLKEEYGAHVIMADEVARRLTEPGGDCFGQILKVFGKEILLPDGGVDRKKLAQVVFSHKDKLEMLNHIVHPAVKSAVQSEIEISKSPLIVIEAALLIEDHYDEICDEIWYVFAEEQVRTDRLVESRGYSREKCQSIMRNQLSDEELRRYCKVVIDNSKDFEQTKIRLNQLLNVSSGSQNTKAEMNHKKI